MRRSNWKGLSWDQCRYFGIKREYGVMRENDVLTCEGMNEGELHGGKLMPEKAKPP